MKKISTLIIALSSLTAIYAQTAKEEARKVILERSKSTQNTGNVILSGNQATKQQEIDQVNRDYDAKIRSVKRSPMSQAQKDKLVRQLEEERATKIHEINNRYYEGDKTSGNTGSNGNGGVVTGGETGTTAGTGANGSKKSKTKTNNGKHLGWEKGKGNPHKTGGKVKYKQKD